MVECSDCWHESQQRSLSIAQYPARYLDQIHKIMLIVWLPMQWGRPSITANEKVLCHPESEADGKGVYIPFGHRIE